MVTMLMVGCSSGSESSKPTDTVPVAGGVLRQGLIRLVTEDPAKATTVSERIFADHLYDGLTSWDPQTFQTRPAIAERWDVSPDQMQWSFHLRPDAKAANG